MNLRTLVQKICRNLSRFFDLEHFGICNYTDFVWVGTQINLFVTVSEVISMPKQFNQQHFRLGGIVRQDMFARTMGIDI